MANFDNISLTSVFLILKFCLTYVPNIKALILFIQILM